MSQKAVNWQKKILNKIEQDGLEYWQICGERFTGWPGSDKILEVLKNAEEITGDDLHELTSLSEWHKQELNQDMFDIVLDKLVGPVHLNQVDFLFRFTHSGCHITND